MCYFNSTNYASHFTVFPPHLRAQVRESREHEVGEHLDVVVVLEAALNVLQEVVDHNTI